MRMFPILVLSVALLIAGNAAYFSVKGIGLLFAGSFLSVIIMASSLEIGKLVTVSLLYRKWHEMTFSLKSYLSLALLFLMAITSVGIYGFLSDAYQDTKTKVELYESQITSIESENINTQKEIDAIQNAKDVKNTKTSDNLNQYQKIYDDFAARMQTKRDQLNDRIKTLDEQVAAVQAEKGGLFSSKDKKLKELKAQQQPERDSINQQLSEIEDQLKQEYNKFLEKVDGLSDQPEADNVTDKIKPLYVVIRSNEKQIVELKGLIGDTDIGSFKFISESLNMETDDAVKWFILIIVIVFDPLAVCLMIGYNMFVMRHEYDGYVNVEAQQKIDNEDKPKSVVRRVIDKILPAKDPRRRQHYR